MASERIPAAALSLTNSLSQALAGAIVACRHQTDLDDRPDQIDAALDRFIEETVFCTRELWRPVFGENPGPLDSESVCASFTVLMTAAFEAASRDNIWDRRLSLYTVYKRIHEGVCNCVYWWSEARNMDPNEIRRLCQHILEHGRKFAERGGE
jgi:hypothetical protein